MGNLRRPFTKALAFGASTVGYRDMKNSVIPMVPPVFNTSTRASAAEGDVANSSLSIELQLDSFLLRHQCL
ncbi:hypothetical protein EYF80_047597 [Liparis tanakae]|uniref:Uncharacterized protein n=1 Tax=Liparis tanakae TaxID=230148 RepID=A0A4Z2FLZ5_9TELE|nr:hypothetical protein EYF80_047597 [Liparis tanakae]